MSHVSLNLNPYVENNQKSWRTGGSFFKVDRKIDNCQNKISILERFLSKLVSKHLKNDHQFHAKNIHTIHVFINKSCSDSQILSVQTYSTNLCTCTYPYPTVTISWTFNHWIFMNSFMIPQLLDFFI